MAWITGTATDYKDLLEQIKDEAVSAGWTLNDYDTGVTFEGETRDFLYLEGPGYGSGYEVFVQIRTSTDAVSNAYSLELRGATGYDSSADWNNQPGVSNNSVFTRLWNASITYWMSITDRRIMLVAKCSNTYHSMYAGFFNPFATPPEYPYPMYIAGDAGTRGAFGALDHDARAVAFPGAGGAYLREPGGTWRNVTVYDDDANYSFVTDNTFQFTIWPYNTQINSSDSPTNQYRYPPYARIEPLNGVADSLFMMNCYVMSMSDRLGVFGVLEGLYWVPGNSLSAEQVLTADGDDYHVFIGLSRSVESPTQFYAVKEA